MKKSLIFLLIAFFFSIPFTAHGQTYVFELELGEPATVRVRFDWPEKLSSLSFSLCNENLEVLHTFSKAYSESENSQDNVVEEWSVPKYLVEEATQACYIAFNGYTEKVTIESAPLNSVDPSTPTPTPTPTLTSTSTPTETPDLRATETAISNTVATRVSATLTAVAQPDKIYMPALKR